MGEIIFLLLKYIDLGPYCIANCVGVIPQRSKIIEVVLSPSLLYPHGINVSTSLQ